MAVGFGLGCKKETNQIDRYKVFSGSWEELSTQKQDGQFSSAIVPEKHLIKYDSVTGRVWSWNCVSENGKFTGGWLEMTDSGYALPNAQHNATQ